MLSRGGNGRRSRCACKSSAFQETPVVLLMLNGADNCLLRWPWTPPSTPLAPIGKSLAPKRRHRAVRMHTLVVSALVQMLLQIKCTLLIDVRLPTQHTHTQNHSPNFSAALVLCLMLQRRCWQAPQAIATIATFI